MVGVAGFEPATPASRTQCSTRLSHTPTWRAAYRQGSAVSQAAKIAPQKEKRRKKRSSKQRCIRPTPALSPPPRRAQTGLAVPAGEWCNGNTAVFGTVILGSSPSSPATSSFQIHIRPRRPHSGAGRRNDAASQFSTGNGPGVPRPAFSPWASACRVRRAGSGLKFFQRLKPGLGFKGQGGVCPDPSRFKSLLRRQVFVFSRTRRSFDKLRLRKALIFGSSGDARIIATLKLLSQQRRPDSACPERKNQLPSASHGLESSRICRCCSQDSLTLRGWQARLRGLSTCISTGRVYFQVKEPPERHSWKTKLP